MARMVPSTGPVEDSESAAERRLFEVFHTQVDADWTVVHSTYWHSVDDDGRVMDGEADFIVICPRHGVLVLEIKGGRVSLDGRTKVWSTVTAGGKKVCIKDPFKQAMKSMHVLLQLIKCSPDTESFASQYRLGYGVWFPDGPFAKEALALYPPELVLDSRDTDHPAQALERLYAHFAGINPPSPLGAEAVAALVQLVSPDVPDAGEVGRSSLAIVMDGEEAPIFERLKAAQFQRLRAMWQTERQVAVPGPAGTGKTVLAVEMAWRLAAEGLDVLILCANQILADWLDYRMERDPRPGIPRFPVKSVKAMITEVAKAGGQRATQVGPLRINSADDQKTLASILSQNIRALEQRGDLIQYDAVLVDEAQDIEQALWVPLQKLLRDRTNGFFYVFYDEKQRLDLPGKWVFRPAGNRAFLPFTDNIRNTQPIYELMTRLNPELKKYPFTGAAGRPIQYIDPATYANQARSGEDPQDAALRSVLDSLLSQDGGLRSERIMVITCRSEARTRFPTSVEHQSGIHRLRWVRRGEKDGCIALSTARSAKGLEYDVVILTELDGLRDEKKRDAYLYVAVSRAKHHLVVLGSEAEVIGTRPSLWAM